MLLNNINSEVLLNGLLSMPVTKENAVQPASIENRRISYARHISGADSDIAGVTTLGAWVRACSSDAMRVAGEQLLSIEDKVELTAAKGQLPVCFPSVVLSTRDGKKDLSEKLVSYSGIICLDFDFHNAAEARTAVSTLTEIPYIAFVSTSASGRGVYAFALTDSTDYTKHKIYWQAITEDIAERTGYDNDPATKDCTHSRYMAYAPTSAFKDSVVPFSLPEGYEERQTISPPDTGEDEDFPPDASTLAAVEDCVRQWEEAGLILGDGTYKTIRYFLGTSLKNLGEVGFKFYERLCKGYNHPRTPRQEWDMFPDNAAAENTNENKIRLGRFFKILEEAYHIKPTEEEVRLPLDEDNEDIAKLVQEVARGLQCPKEMAIAFMYGAVAAVAGKKFSLRYKDYVNYAQVWIAVVTPSGGSKTPSMQWFFKPVDAIETARYEEYQTALQEWRKDGEEGPKPKRRRYTAADTTPEARDQMLADNPNGLCLKVDELEGFFNDIGRYNKSGEVQRLLQLHSNAPLDADRKTQDSVRVNEPVLSFVGGTQPEVFQRAFGNSQFVGNGFLSRWCFVWAPRKRRDEDEPPVNPVVAKFWADLIGRVEAAEGPFTFQLSPEAEAIYKGYCNELEDKIDRAKEDAQRAMYAKLRVIVLRWSLVTAILAGEYDDKHPEKCAPISDISMRYAVNCGRYFEHTGTKAVDAVRGQSSQMTKKNAIRQLKMLFPGMIQSHIAKGLGVTEAYISKVLKKK